MDKEFQTTFIPKKPMVEESIQRKGSKPLGIFIMVAGLLFLVTIIIAGGLFFYERLLNQQIETSKDSLERAQEAFEPSLIIELQKLNTRLNVSNTLLAQHVAASPLFKLLENLTLKSVQYTQFNYKMNGGQATVSLSGLARRYQTIAEQSILFGENRFITEHIFSNFALTEQGRVAFDLTLTISPELFYFERSLGEVPESVDRMTEALEGANVNMSAGVNSFNQSQQPSGSQVPIVPVETSNVIPTF